MAGEVNLDDVLVNVANEVYDKNVKGENQVPENENNNTEGEQKMEEQSMENTTNEAEQQTETSTNEGQNNVENPQESVMNEENNTEEAPSDNDLQKLFDEVLKQGENVEEKKQEVEKQLEKVQEEVKQTEDSGLKKEVEKLNELLAERDLELDKYKKMVEYLKTEYDKLLKENVELKYGSGSESMLMDAITDDDSVKNFLINKVKYMEDPNDNNKQKLVEAAKTLYENITGVSLDNLIGETKNKELQAFTPAENEPATNVNAGGNTGLDNLLV